MSTPKKNPKHAKQQESKENAGLLARIRRLIKPHKPKERDHTGHFFKP